MASRTPWGRVLLPAVAAVGWAFAGMAVVAAGALRLLGADGAGGSLPRMTAAVVALAVGGQVTPSGDVEAFGLSGPEASTAVDAVPLGVTLVGALLLGVVFLRSLRGAGFTVPGRELAARVAATAAVCVATVGGLAWAGHDVITLDGRALALDDVPGGSDIADTELPGGWGDVGGLLPDRLGDLADAEAAVGFTVRVPETLAGATAWVLAVLLLALLASRRTPLPPALDVLHRAVRPAVSALTGVFLVAVLAGWGAAGFALLGDERPGRIAGAALLGAPNGVWPGVSLGLGVPWHGRASGSLAGWLPDPVDRLLAGGTERELNLARAAELDGRLWFLALAAGLLMLFAGVLTAVRTPDRARRGGGRLGTFRFAVRCAVPTAAATAAALALLTGVSALSADASLSVLGYDAFDAGLALRGEVPAAAALGALWGAAAGFAGALLARLSGAAGSAATAFARGTAGPGHASGRTYPDLAYLPGPYRPSDPYRAPNADTNPYLRLPDDVHGSPTVARPQPPPRQRGARPVRRADDDGRDGPPPPGVPGTRR
ncbi:streptophobe family protein [Streptomyces sp. NPDC060194]|uniref:streptophobe family protein n=1 Tax=Streptomyces sp. NPDC060194 TaxID=3347069 RepID=UPI00364A23CB